MRILSFRLAILLISLLLFWFEYRFYQKWKRRLAERPWFGAVKWSYWIFVGLVHLPIVVLMLYGRVSWQEPLEGFSLAYYYVVLAWYYALLFLLPLYGLLLLIVRTPGMLMRGAAGTRALFHKIALRRPGKTPAAAAPTPSQAAANQAAANSAPFGKGLSRRNFLEAGVDALPFLGFGLALGGMAAGTDVATTSVRLPIRDLHEDLKGLRIVQISDLHVGNLIHERYLKICAERLKLLRADVLVVTGDIIDNNNFFLPMLGRFFRELAEHFPRGMFGVAGNHDYIHDAEPLFRDLPASGIRMLRNENVVIVRGQGRLNLMGLDYPARHYRELGRRMEISRKFFQKASIERFPDAPLAVLNHHPSDFDYLQNENVDLLLCGHTHGGQIALTDRRESRLALGSSMFPYYRGLYEKNGCKLYVNSGLGHWLPLRVNCPPEITLLELS